MLKCRLIFEKTGKAKYISHLDLMRTMQRVFMRADVPIVHTMGFNPHPYMVFALPLSVGVESVCEMMDIETSDGEDLSTYPDRLNSTMPEGLKIKEAYAYTRKFKEIAYVEAEGYFEYDNGVSEEIISEIIEFFAQPEIVIKKRTKRGINDTDIKPGIKSVSFEKVGDNKAYVRTCVTAQNPTTNPDLLWSALKEKRPDLAPDFAYFKRLEVLDCEGNVFR